MRRVPRSAPRIAGTAAAGAAVLLLAVPGAGAQAGGGVAYPGSASGGTPYGALISAARPPRPVARVFGLVPSIVTAPALPRVRLRVDQPGARTVRARLSLVPVPVGGSGSAVSIDLGRVPTGREVGIAWPATVAPAPGRYAVRLWVKGRGGRLLARGARATDRASLTVRPAPVVTPVIPPAGAPAVTAGVFPVRGPHTYGEGIGAARRGHLHEGQDVAAAAGTPVVAPVSGTVAKVAFQAGGAGWYVVEHADDGRDFFFAHCRTGSAAVARDARVLAGATLCAVGSTGSATGPHLHFEIWPGGWRVSKASRPIDPLPQLQAWDR